MEQLKIFTTLFLIFGILAVVQAYKQEEKLYGAQLLIDCGSSVQSDWNANKFISWETDEQFIKTGENKILPTNQTSPAMNTLRFFPQGHKNCYQAPFYDGYQNAKYLFRAGFYYGNYDGLSKPPSFGLEIDGYFWANVTTSMSEEPVYYEFLYMRKGLKTRICLVRNVEYEIPFISSIEAVVMFGDVYRLMNNKTAFHLHSRINYGANQSVEQSMAPNEDRFTRIWKSRQVPEYLNIQTQLMSNRDYGSYLEENYPPMKVMDYAIQAKHIDDSLNFSLNFSSNASLQAYIVLYFMDPTFDSYGNRSGIVEIYINGNKMVMTDVPYGSPGDEYRVVSLFPVNVIGGSANLSIAAVKGSNVGPILNAMEVYSAIHVSSKGGNLLINFLVLFFISLLHFTWFVGL